MFKSLHSKQFEQIKDDSSQKDHVSQIADNKSNKTTGAVLPTPLIFWENNLVSPTERKRKTESKERQTTVTYNNSAIWTGKSKIVINDQQLWREVYRYSRAMWGLTFGKLCFSVPSWLKQKFPSLVYWSLKVTGGMMWINIKGSGFTKCKGQSETRQ